MCFGFVSGVSLETGEEDVIDSAELRFLRVKLEKLGLNSESCMPGQYNGLICPMVSLQECCFG